MPASLIFLPYLQEWDGTALGVRLLVAPQANPLDPMAPGEPSFTDAAFSFEIRLVQGLASLPTTGSAFQPMTQAQPVVADARTLCTALETDLGIDSTLVAVDPRRAGRQLLKYATPGYRQATGYADGKSRYLVTDDTYHCALKSGMPAGTVLKSPPPVIGWGKALATALRQPLLAERIGLIRSFTITPDAGYFDNGGWLYVSLTAGSPGATLLGLPGAVKTYAARVPRLTAGTARRVFTSVQFPVAAAVPAASYDDLFREVIDYDDGFAKAVYARQPLLADPLDEGSDGDRPHDDHGVQLGWDDEQVAQWFNRQIDPTAATLDAPMGVIGYRIDARETGDAAWHSLVLASSELTIGGIDLGPYTGEYPVEVAPNKLMSETLDRFWIPAYYTSWKGPSLAGPDHTARLLQGIDKPSILEGIQPDVGLRYGKHYEFRVRLVDHTGAGPEIAEVPVNPAPQPHAPLHFLRWNPPAPVRIDVAPPVVPDPSTAPSSLSVRRPLLAYPAYVYAGGSAADLLADLPQAAVEHRSVGLPDPDVVELAIELLVALPGSDGGYRSVYTTTRAFPAGAADPAVLELDWQDVADATTLVPPATGPLPVPTARLVRLSVHAVTSDTADYYGAPDVRHGAVTEVALRKESSDERSLLRVALAEAIEAIFLQPDHPVDPAVALAQRAAGLAAVGPDNVLGRLASALDLAATDVGLRAHPGHRVIFGCSASLRHLLGPDGASLGFGSLGDLSLTWLVAIRLELDRDWSWDGLDHLSVVRDGVEVGRIEPTGSVGHEALDGAPLDHSELCFLDAIDPKPAAGTFPAELHPTYSVVAVLRDPSALHDPATALTLDLPIVTPPAQVPRLASAGLMLSPYQHDAGYSSTDQRERMLWLEFAEPPADPADIFYARVLAYAADPALTGNADATTDVVEPPLPIDPEPIRTIVPGQSDDSAGANAMQALVPTESLRHFLVPLGPGLTATSDELFGFFTYELRAGHHTGWSTAQGRYGRPLRVTGVQHPNPPLSCAVTHNRAGLEVSAPFADPVDGGRSLRPYPPITELFVLLYAQVFQADAATMRNVLLANRAALSRAKRWGNHDQRPAADIGTATWSESEIQELLGMFGLGPDTPLSCLVVETLPGDEPIPDPLGSGLGYERFLRTSALTAVPGLC